MEGVVLPCSPAPDKRVRKDEMDSSDNTLIVPQTQMRVRDSNFEISVYTWDEFTLDILRKYADWKCNNGNKISNENKINNIDNEINVKNNVKTEEKQEDIKLAKASEFGNCCVYKDIVDEIINKTSKVFDEGDVAELIFQLRGNEITKGTSYLYARTYIGYLIKNNLVTEKNHKFYKIHTESETDWTASDEDYLRENFFLISFEKLCNGLNKSPEEIREKAIRFFGKKV